MRTTDDPYFHLPEVIPWVPGSGPFHIKGWGYAGDCRFYERFVPGGLDGVGAHVKDPRVASFLKKTYRDDDWYDVTPKLYLAQAAAKARGVGHEAHVREVSAWHAQDKFSGIYRPLLKVVSSEMLALWIPRLTSMFYDFGSTESRVIGKKVVRVVRYGVPRIAVQWWSWAATAYFEFVLLTAGARIPHIRWLPTEPDGARLGMELYRMPLEITWT